MLFTHTIICIDEVLCHFDVGICFEIWKAVGCGKVQVLDMHKQLSADQSL